MPTTRTTRTDLEFLTRFPGVKILDRTPAGSAAGIPNGYLSVIGEPTDDDGNPNVPSLVLTPSDFRETFGSGVPYFGSSSDGWAGNIWPLLSMSNAFPFIFTPVDAAATKTAGATPGSSTYSYATFSRPRPGYATAGSLPGPYRLDAADTITVTTETSGPHTVTWDAAPALLECSNAETYDVSGNKTLTLKIDGGGVQTIAFTAGYFANAAAATAEEIALAINAQIEGAKATSSTGDTKVSLTSDKKGTGSKVQVTGGTANTALAFGTGVASGTGDVADIRNVTASEVAARIAADAADCTVDVQGSLIYVVSTVGGPGGSVAIGAGTANDVLGFPTAVQTGGTGTAPAGTIPAGTILMESVSGQKWLTLEDAVFAEDDLSESARIRASSNVTVFAAAGAINTISADNPTLFDTAFAVSADETHPPNMDTRYATAITAACNPANETAALGQFFVARRHTATVAAALTTAVESRSGILGRGAMCFLSPVIGTAYATAVGSSGVGVGSSTFGGRSERRQYVWPPIEQRFTVRGTNVVVDVHADLTAAAFRANIAPERNINVYEPTQMRHVLGLGADASAGSAALYTALHAAGITTIIYEGSALGYKFLNDITTSSDSDEKSATRRIMADFIQASLAERALPYVGEPISAAIRAEVEGSFDRFLNGLKTGGRIYDYKITDATTASDRASGIMRMEVAVDLNGNADFIIIPVTAGPGILEQA